MVSILDKNFSFNIKRKRTNITVKKLLPPQRVEGASSHISQVLAKPPIQFHQELISTTTPDKTLLSPKRVPGYFWTGDFLASSYAAGSWWIFTHEDQFQDQVLERKIEPVVSSYRTQPTHRDICPPALTSNEVSLSVFPRSLAPAS